MLKRGDVVLVLFPNSDLRTAKTRPALIVQADQLQTGLPQVIVAMISSRLERAGHPSRVLLTLASASSLTPRLEPTTQKSPSSSTTWRNSCRTPIGLPKPCP